MDPISGGNPEGKHFLPDFYVDVTPTFAIKREMLACHASQRNWLRKQHGMDEYLETLDRASLRRGSEVGIEHAEGFRQYLGHPFPQNNVLLELLAQDGRGRQSS